MRQITPTMKGQRGMGAGAKEDFPNQALPRLQKLGAEMLNGVGAELGSPSHLDLRRPGGMTAMLLQAAAS